MRRKVKKLGRLWLGYTELQGDFCCYNSYLLTLTCKIMQGCGLPMVPINVQYVNGHLLIKIALHS